MKNIKISILLSVFMSCGIQCADDTHKSDSDEKKSPNITMIDDELFPIEGGNSYTGSGISNECLKIFSEPEGFNFGYNPRNQRWGYIKEQQNVLFGEYDGENVNINDKRKTVINDNKYPNRAVLSLQMMFPGDDSIYVGTATLIWKDIALTAAHNIYDHSLKTVAKSVKFFTGRHGDTFEKSAYIKKYAFHKKYLTHNSEDHDYAILHLSEPIGNQLGWVFPIPYEENKHISLTISGFPGKVYRQGQWKIKKGQYLYEHFGNIISHTTHRLHYTIDTTKGQSGSSVRFRTGEDLWSTVGVHTTGNENWNEGVKINEENLKNIRNWSRYIPSFNVDIPIGSGFKLIGLDKDDEMLLVALM